MLLIAAGAFDAELRLIAEQAQMLTLASGAAIALRQGEGLVCRARAGSVAPDLGSELDTQSGLSGECVRSARNLVCDDTENDARVNLDVCHYLGIRSIAVLPICLGREVIGIFEVFSAHPRAFSSNEVAALESMRDLVISVIRPGPVQAEGPAMSALAARAAGEQPSARNLAVFSDPDDDLICEIEQRLQPPPGSDPLTSPLELVKGGQPSPASRSVAPSVAPPTSPVPPGFAAVSAPPPSVAPRPVDPPPRVAAPHFPAPPTASVAPEASAPPLAASSAPVSNFPTSPGLAWNLPALPAIPPFANADPEDDLLCEIEMRGEPTIHLHALSTFAPAPHQPAEPTISRKLILAGVLVALAGLLWLRWCSQAQHVQSAAVGHTLPAAATAAPSPAAQPAAPPAATAPPSVTPAPPWEQPAPPAVGTLTPENSSREASANRAPEPFVTPRPWRETRQTHAPAPTVSQKASRPASSTRGESARSLAEKAAPPPTARASPLAPTSTARSAPAQPASDTLQTARPLSPPSPGASPTLQFAPPPPFTLRPSPAALQPTAPAAAKPSPPAGQLSLSQAVVTAAPDSSGRQLLSQDALQLLRDSANGGDAGAQLALAVRYATGDGVRQSYPEAMKWFTKARAQGITPTQPRAVQAWTKVQQWAQSHSEK